MHSDWIELPLEDCLDALLDYRGKTPQKSSTGIPLITAKIVKAGRVLPPHEFISEAEFSRWMTRGMPHVGDIVLTTEAPLGEVGQIERLPVALAQRIVTLRGREGLLENDFLLYLLQTEYVQSQLMGRSSGTTVVGIKQSELRRVKLRLPKLSHQRQIAGALKALDARISVLEEISSTVEAIAQTIFKSWFMDYDPVRAKAGGREPEGIDADTAGLFPSEFEESKLGHIPMGWTATTVGQAFQLTMGQSPPGETYNEIGEGLSFYQGRADFGSRFPKRRVFCTAPTRFAKDGDTLVSVRAPVGSLNRALEDCSIGRGVAAVRHETAPSYAYYSMWSLEAKFSGFEAEGTVFGSINKRQFESLPFLSPPPSLVRAFEDLIGPMDERIRVNELQLRSLTTLRDTLLPRLISGQIRVPEAQEAIQEVLS